LYKSLRIKAGPNRTRMAHAQLVKLPKVLWHDFIYITVPAGLRLFKWMITPGSLNRSTLDCQIELGRPAWPESKPSLKK